MTFREFTELWWSLVAYVVIAVVFVTISAWSAVSFVRLVLTSVRMRLP